MEDLNKQQKEIVNQIKKKLTLKKPKPFQRERVYPIADIAKELGISRRCIYLFLKSTNPSFKTVYILAKYFDIELI